MTGTVRQLSVHGMSSHLLLTALTGRWVPPATLGVLHQAPGSASLLVCPVLLCYGTRAGTGPATPTGMLTPPLAQSLQEHRSLRASGAFFFQIWLASPNPLNPSPDHMQLPGRHCSDSIWPFGTDPPRSCCPRCQQGGHTPRARILWAQVLWAAPAPGHSSPAQQERQDEYHVFREQIFASF